MTFLVSRKMELLLRCLGLSCICLGLCSIIPPALATITPMGNHDNRENFVKLVSLKPSRPLEMFCNVTEGSFAFKWTKNNVEIKQAQDSPLFTITGDDTYSRFYMAKPKEDVLANYTCQVLNRNNSSVEGSLNYFVVPLPFVKLPDYMTVIEGEKLRLECEVRGRPTLSWQIENVTYERSEGRVVLEPNEKNLTNAVLMINEATLDDRGNYSCIGFNSEGQSLQDSTYIRIKDKYAALWPFLGICAEVFVLCAIILIYEKKRNKAELEESDTDQSPDQKNTPDHGKDSVRQRK